MRRLLLVVLLAAALTGLQACSNACQDLGDRICACSGGGTSADTCKQQVKNQLAAVGISGSDKAFCAARLAQCAVPAQLVLPNQVEDAQFCEWINTDAGKVCCGLAVAPTTSTLADTDAVCADLKTRAP